MAVEYLWECLTKSPDVDDVRKGGKNCVESSTYKRVAYEEGDED